jgi:hypothetical protein
MVIKKLAVRTHQRGPKSIHKLLVDHLSCFFMDIERLMIAYSGQFNYIM